ncbi:hypothetical protein D9756_003125 [Leucocoprinus leucothites]|uniref:DUF6697 domain-containing protein n=1 Tax=Leucocoprinus leucothites TaxID=201217 RepID=A0A8H5LJR6_9AGAR|nr:hypothetical protein D9756_003125 [Leucoagaricus leucothites]
MTWRISLEEPPRRVKREPEEDTSALADDTLSERRPRNRDALSNLSNSDKEKTRKRPRRDPVNTDGVTTPERVNVKLEQQSDTRRAIMESRQNPKMKIKTKLEFNLETLLNRLDGLKPLIVDDETIPQEIRNFAFPREFISSLYGGNTQETFPLIGEKFLKEHGLDHWMYPNLEYNPAAPRMPGHPGLFFIPTPELGDMKKQKLLSTPRFYRVVTRLATNKWLYMGDYMLQQVASLTVSEWEEQSRAFKKTWSREICDKGYGQKVLKRMAARKRFGCNEPDENQLFAVAESGEWKRFSPADVEAAFAKGEETFVIWQMDCREYDVGFQRRLYEEFKTRTAPGRDSKEPKNKGKKVGKTKGAARSKTTKVGKKRKREEISDSELSELESIIDNNEEYLLYFTR